MKDGKRRTKVIVIVYLYTVSWLLQNTDLRRFVEIMYIIRMT